MQYVSAACYTLLTAAAASYALVLDQSIYNKKLQGNMSLQVGLILCRVSVPFWGWLPGLSHAKPH